MKSKSIQIKTKLILISILSVAVFVCLIFSVAVFWINNTAQTDWYISNIVSHITYNLNNIINGAENRSLKILSNDTIQNNLRIQNDVKTSAFETINSKTRIKNAIEVDTLYDQYVVSTSVISDTGVDTTVKMTLFKDMLSDVITKDEVYEANGKLLWALTEDSHRICICRAILDLESMKPLGYVGIVYEPSIMGDIIKETSSKIKCESVLLSPSGTIISCKDD